MYLIVLGAEDFLGIRESITLVPVLTDDTVRKIEAAGFQSSSGIGVGVACHFCPLDQASLYSLESHSLLLNLGAADFLGSGESITLVSLLTDNTVGKTKVISSAAGF